MIFEIFPNSFQARFKNWQVFMRQIHLPCLVLLLTVLVACSPPVTRLIIKDTPPPEASDEGGILPEASDDPPYEDEFHKKDEEDIERIFDKNRRIAALLLPLSGTSDGVRSIAEALFQAAQLALFDIGDSSITLLVKDTRATPEGALIAARAAYMEGAEFIIGPLFGDNARGLWEFAEDAQLPILSFSNDRTIASSWVWAFGFLPEESVERVIIEALSQGLSRFGVLIPQNDFGARLEPHLALAIERYGGELTAREVYSAENTESMFAPVQRLGRYAERRAAHIAELARLTIMARELAPSNLITAPEVELFTGLQATAPALVAEYENLKKSETLGEIPFDAVMILEGGLRLRNLAPLLPYFDIDHRFVKFLGTNLWDDPQLSAEPPLHNGWFASVAPNGRKKFSTRFEQTYKTAPPQIASLAYDGVSLFASLVALAPDTPVDYASMTNVNGFRGIDGIFRLTGQGISERGLAVLEITPRGSRVITPAPLSFVEHERRETAALALAQILSQRKAPLFEAEPQIDDSPRFKAQEPQTTQDP